MNYIIVPILLISLYFNLTISATGMYDSLQDHIVLMGRKMETIDNLPVIDKLTNFLPFAAISKSFQQCPGQSLMVIAGVIVYFLSYGEYIRSFLNIKVVKHGEEKTTDKIHITDDLFVFDGDDEDDAMEQEDTEDELLESSSRIKRKMRDFSFESKFL